MVRNSNETTMYDAADRQDDDEGFQNYEVTTVAGGNAFLYATLLIGIIGIGIPPLIVTRRRRMPIIVVERATVSDIVAATAKRQEGGDTMEGNADGEVQDVSICTVARWDEESRRIGQLVAPFMVRAVANGVAEITRLGLIGRFVSTRALSAYLMVDLMLGLGVCLLKGFSLALRVLSSQAIGAGNCTLAGQYAQISLFFYVLTYVPLLVFWMCFIHDVILWFGFDEETARIGQDFAPLFMTAALFSGMDNCVSSLLDVIGKEMYNASSIVIQRVVGTVLTFVVVVQSPEIADLRGVGLVMAATAALGWIVNAAIVVCKGWLDPYYGGLVGSGLAVLVNFSAAKVLLGTSVALSLGEMMVYGEWQVLTVFASCLGPAEVAAWAILGSLSEFLELLIEAVADVADVRTAFLLGNAQPFQAKVSSYKTIYFGQMVAIVTSSIVFIWTDEIPTWLTSDVTLQNMVADVLPLLGIGNLCLTVGTICWTVLGAQGRYTLATTWGFFGQLVTMVLAAISSIVFRLEPQGQAVAYVTGYMVSGTIQSCIMLQTDWTMTSRRVIERANECQHGSNDLTEKEEEEGLEEDDDDDFVVDEEEKCV
jgi:Na+-driven multidrug efflux pump